MLRMCVVLFSILPWFASAQDPVAVLRTSDERIYNPKAKGLTDLVVDVVDPQLTKQLNDQMIFGIVNEVSFRFYWTAKPERIAIEIAGLPEGFREIKEELKARAIGNFESIVPIPIEAKFKDYQLRSGTGAQRTIVATDKTGLAPIPEFVFSVDAESRISQIVAKKAIGTQVTTLEWKKSPWSEPRSHAQRSISIAVDGPQSTEVTTETSWQVVAGIGLPASVKTSTRQTLKAPGQPKPVERKVEEYIYFKNYKVNQGEAMKWFLGQSGTN